MLTLVLLVRCRSGSFLSKATGAVQRIAWIYLPFLTSMGDVQQQATAGITDNNTFCCLCTDELRAV